MAISERDRERRREYRKANDVHPYRHVVPQIPKTDESELARLLAEIPKEDVRTLTARLCGDPNPADRRRSA
jgi:hypothetical protein